jgi:hypothetical protein
MELVAERSTHPTPGRAETPAPVSPSPRLEIFVVSTSAELARATLKKTGSLANRLGARILLWVLQAIPYTLPLSASAELFSFDESLIRKIANDCQVDTTVFWCACRDEWGTLQAALSPESLVVVAVRRGWWPTREKSLARKLRHAGHEVILTETE